MEDIIKITKKGHPVFVVKKKVSDLDKTKLSNKFLAHQFNDKTEVYVKCLENGTLDLRGKLNEYRLVPLTAELIKKN